MTTLNVNKPSLEILAKALRDAISWQESLAEAYSHMKQDPQYSVIQKKISQYKKLLVKVRESIFLVAHKIKKR